MLGDFLAPVEAALICSIITKLVLCVAIGVSSGRKRLSTKSNGLTGTTPIFTLTVYSKKSMPLTKLVIEGLRLIWVCQLCDGIYIYIHIYITAPSY